MKTAEIGHLYKEYPSFSLRDVSFSLEAGEITGFIGRNGAGKTTTIKSMLNLVHPSGGEIRFFGMPLYENENEIKQRIGYSAGAMSFYPKKRLCDIAAVTKTFYKNWDDNAYRKYLDIFSLDESKSPSEMSEGMKVKSNLLLSLSHHAEILILDEPTSGLDPFSRDELTDLFVTLKKDGVAIFFSTHITSDLQKCADSIVYIRDGQIVSAERKEQFIKTNGRDGETLDDIILRLEREARNEKTVI